MTRQHAHFVGIGGAGMSAIAEVLASRGWRVTGSDRADSAALRRLASLGVGTFVGHAAEQVGDAAMVVASTAVPPDNPELAVARERGLPVLARAAMLAHAMQGLEGIACAGTHGKTTTTSLVASALLEAGLDPSFVIGGQLLNAGAAGANARHGQGEHIVVEADESDASFLLLAPAIAVVTNIDADHMETYGHSVARLHDAFVGFLHRLPPDGLAVLCRDDAGVRAVLPRVERTVVTYGLQQGAHLQAVDVAARSGGGMAFVARQPGHADLAVTLNLAGVHNVLNALAAIAVARAVGAPDAPVARALAKFEGVGRRFQRWGDVALPDGGRYALIDDYGHHPAELAAVLAAARAAFPGRRLMLAFQPHRYSRTRDCFGDFAAVIARFDAALVTDVYPAGEAPIDGVSGERLAQAAGARFVAGVAALPQALRAAARDGDVVLLMGAGSIGELPAMLSGGAA